MKRKNTAFGIDPGIGNTGWALVERLPSGYCLLHSGVICTAARTPIGKRLDTHYSKITELLTEHTPATVVIESVFFNRNITSCISTASVIAVAELACEQSGIPTLQIKPQVVKSAVTGSGTASKQSVKKMVNKLLGANIASDHEADSAAAAIAGLLQQHF